MTKREPAPDNRKLTIRDIARLAGVSRSTVSLVINHDSRISSDTRQRVQEVIRRAGYEPNAMARGLARRRAGMIAVVVPRTSDHVFSDYYFSEAMSGIGDALAARGYRMLIESATEAFIRDEHHHKLFREGQIDGMMLVGTLTTDTYILDIAAQHRVLLVNSHLPGVASVMADNYEGSRAMVRYLVALGHRRIAHLGGLDTTNVGFDRGRGFRDAMAEAGVPLLEEWQVWGNFSEESGYRCGRELLTRPGRPTAVFAANDMMAIGCLRAAEELGLSVPRDVTVVGADDVRLASYVRPRLTTIRQPMYEIGRLATECLLQLPARSPGSPDVQLHASDAAPGMDRTPGPQFAPGVDSAGGGVPLDAGVSIAAQPGPLNRPLLVVPTELVERESSGPPPVS